MDTYSIKNLWHLKHDNDEKYKNMSLKELTQIINNNARIITSRPLFETPSASQLYEDAERIAENELCIRLADRLKRIEKEKKERKESAERMAEEATDDWYENQPSRERDAIAKLKNVFSANGQLIFAILEEDGDKTFDEIVNWCPEFQMMEENDIKALLDEFCKLKLIEFTKDKKYHLLYLTYDTPYRFPWSPKENKSEICRKMLDELNVMTVQYSFQQVLLIIIAIYNSDKVIFPQDLCEWVETIYRRSNESESFGYSKNEKFMELISKHLDDEIVMPHHLGAMVKQGILVEQPKGGFYFPFIVQE